MPAEFHPQERDSEALSVPTALRERYAKWQWTVVWQEVPQVTTYRLVREHQSDLYLKVAVLSWFPSIHDEVARLRWAHEYLPVPRVVEAGEDDRVGWMLTNALSGRNASHPLFRKSPIHVVDLLARGLRDFHCAPALDCPFRFCCDTALEHVERRARSGLIDPSRDFHEEFAHHTVASAIHELHRLRPRTEDLVVCHGDYCMPNILIDGGGVTGYVDLGELAVADRWWDLAVATWSLTWNLGAGFEDRFLTTYDVERDPDRMTFYRLLYDLVS